MKHQTDGRGKVGQDHRESVLSLLPGSSTSGVGSKLAGDVGILTAVSCEILIVSRFMPKRLASSVSGSDSGSVGPRHQDISFWTGFMPHSSRASGRAKPSLYSTHDNACYVKSSQKTAPYGPSPRWLGSSNEEPGARWCAWARAGGLCFGGACGSEGPGRNARRLARAERRSSRTCTGTASRSRLADGAARGPGSARHT